MKYGLRLLLLLFAVSLVGHEAGTIRACSCGPTPTVLDAYEHAGAVVVASVISIQKADDASEKWVDGVRSADVVVENVYKGPVKVADVLTFTQGGGADCVWTFDEQSVGCRYLFYLALPPKGSSTWYASECGRSARLEFASDDLRYLDNRMKVLGKTRLSGTIRFQGGRERSVEGLSVSIVGAGAMRKVETDKAGVYEVYDLPPGKYLVTPGLARGWKIDAFWLRYSSSVDRGHATPSLGGIPVVMEAGKHASLDLYFEPDNGIRGTVVDPTGTPMRDVCVAAVRVGSEGHAAFDCTARDGSFTIDRLAPDAYILVVNDDGKVSGEEPFRTFYYPGTFDRERATAIRVGEGEVVTNLLLRVPEMEDTVTIEGILLHSDGKPVVGESVVFAASASPPGTEADAQAETDGNGRFSLRLLRGVAGSLYGELTTFDGEYERCPELQPYLKTNTSLVDIHTPTVDIAGDRSVFDLRLVLPIPHCEKAKQE